MLFEDLVVPPVDQTNKEVRMRWQRRILIVDDDPDLVNAVTMILKSKKYEVAAAYDGNEGLAKAKTEKPDLIVLDVMMPDKDGYAVCKELKADRTLGKIPVLLLTAVASHVSDDPLHPTDGDGNRGR